MGRTFVYLLTGKEPNEFYDPYTDEYHWRTKVTHVSPLLADFIDHLMARLPGERPANTQVILEKLGQIEQTVYPPKAPFTVSSKPSTNAPLLQRFEFLVRMNATWEINRRRGQTEFFTEELDNGVILEMVAIPGGTFMMGSPDTEAERRDNENPQHSVNVAPFYMGKFTVTQAQWRAVAALPQVNRKLDANPSNFKGDTLPVETISWHDAIEFCARLSKKKRRTYRLPSEAEWEYACRAGTTTPFHFGKTITTDLTNYNGNKTYGSGSKGIYRKKTTPVSRFQVANNCGLYDMHGNVWEWCADHWHHSYQGAPTDGRAWIDGNNNDNRPHLRRGGSWFSLPRDCRSASRYFNVAGIGYGSLGFRVVCAAPGVS